MNIGVKFVDGNFCVKLFCEYEQVHCVRKKCQESLFLFWMTEINAIYENNLSFSRDGTVKILLLIWRLMRLISEI